MTGETEEQPGMETEEEEEGADEQRHCQEVSEEETEERWQAQRKLCVYVYIRLRKTKPFNMRTESDKQKRG